MYFLNNQINNFNNIIIINMNDSDKSAKVHLKKEQKAGDWLKSNKMKLNNKQKKKIKEWSKLKAFES